jgi:hypothetical protein
LAKRNELIKLLLPRGFFIGERVVWLNYYKGRTVEKGQKIDVYRNLHHGGFSIRDSKTKQVLAHADSVRMRGAVVFKVNEKGRQKTIEERRKRVHAYVQGYFVSADEPKPADMDKVIIYDPYLTPLFKDVSSGSYVVALEGEVFFDGTVVYTNNSAVLHTVLV